MAGSIEQEEGSPKASIWVPSLEDIPGCMRTCVCTCVCVCMCVLGGRERRGLSLKEQELTFLAKDTSSRYKTSVQKLMEKLSFKTRVLTMKSIVPHTQPEQNPTRNDLQ